MSFFMRCCMYEFISFNESSVLNDSSKGLNVRKNSITISLNSSQLGFLIHFSLNQTIAQLPPVTCGKRSNARSISNLLSSLIILKDLTQLIWQNMLQSYQLLHVLWNRVFLLSYHLHLSILALLHLSLMHTHLIHYMQIQVH